jgi:hypothetical protein
MGPSRGLVGRQQEVASPKDHRAVQEEEERNHAFGLPIDDCFFEVERNPVAASRAVDEEATLVALP